MSFNTETQRHRDTEPGEISEPLSLRDSVLKTGAGCGMGSFNTEAQRHGGTEDAMDENDISKVVLDAAILVHRTLGGPGLLESVYQDALVYELRLRGLKVEKEVIVPVTYKGVVVGDPLRLDILVENRVVVECKATEKDNPIFAVQTLTYLRLLGLHLGLLINFGKETLVAGYRRVVN